MDRNFIEQLRKYQKRVEYWLNFIKDKKGKEFNKEQNTTVKFVIPLLEMLGWDHLSRDVEFEYHLKDKKRGTRHVDIALYLYDTNPKRPKIVVEVKPIPRTNQFDIKGPTRQIFRDYLRANKVAFGILTNGMELIVFTGRFVRHDSKRARTLFRLKLEDFIEFSDVLWLLSKEMIENQRFDKLAKMLQSHDQYWKSWFFPKRDMIKHKKFHELAEICKYKNEEYWRKKTGSKELNEYILPLVFAKKFLERRN